jgi:hypothetical protein
MYYLILIFKLQLKFSPGSTVIIGVCTAGR